STRAPVWAAACAWAAPADRRLSAAAIAASDAMRTVLVIFLSLARKAYPGVGPGDRLTSLLPIKGRIRPPLQPDQGSDEDDRGEKIQSPGFGPRLKRTDRRELFRLLRAVLAGVVGLAFAIVLATGFENTMQSIVTLVAGIFVHAIDRVKRHLTLPGLGVER